MYSKKPPPDLKPCPFCASSASVYEHDGPGMAYVICSDCNAWGPIKPSPWSAGRAWNRRTDEAR